MSALHANPMYVQLVSTSAEEALRVIGDEFDKAGLLPLSTRQTDEVALGLKVAVSHALRTLSLSPCDVAGFLSLVADDTRAGIAEDRLELGRPVGEDGVSLIARERMRQMTTGRYDAKHDDGHDDGSILDAAVCYADTAAVQVKKGITQLPGCYLHKDWPWQRQDWKPSNDPLRNVIRAAALLAAEADRILRKRAAMA